MWRGRFDRAIVFDFAIDFGFDLFVNRHP